MRPLVKSRLRKNAFLLVLLLLVILLEALKFYPGLIEHYYSTGLYPPLSLLLRRLTAILPFSLGDALVGLVIIYLLYRLVRAVRSLAKKGIAALRITAVALRKTATVMLAIWVAFYALWGLNYYRLGSQHQLQIVPDAYSNSDLDTLLQVFEEKIQSICSDSLLIEQQKTRDCHTIGGDCVAAYSMAAKEYPFIQYQKLSLKTMLMGPLQSYTGYGGYIFPFTGEAHVNFYMPAFNLHFTTCHEMAHQVGYGTESEANLIGFLACRRGLKKVMQYSAYCNMQWYALVEMSNRDSLLARNYYQRLPALLKKDRQENTRFGEMHQNPAQPVINWVYEKILQGNNQPAGLQSYNYVVAWLIAYGKKYGWHKL